MAAEGGAQKARQAAEGCGARDLELSSVADLPLDIDFLSSDSMSICPAHLLEGRVAGAKVRR